MDSFSEYSSSVEQNIKHKVGNNNGKRPTKVLKLSTDPQSVAARERRHRISDRFKILQSLVPGGAKMDTCSMLEEAIHYVKFLKAQIWLHQAMIKFVDDEMSLLISHDHQQSALFSPENFVGLEVDSSPPFGWPEICFQGGEAKGFDGTMNY